MKVTSGEFLQRFDPLSDQAAKAPLTITKDGKDHLVLMSAEEFARLNKRERQAMATGDVPPEVAALIAKAEVDPRHAPLDEELSDWQP